MAKLSYPDMIAELHACLVNDNSHGYSQPNRYGDGTQSVYTLSDGTVCVCHGGDYDCSSSVQEVIESVGLDSGYFTYTGNEIDGLLSTGEWMEVSLYERERGDVLWIKGHTGIYQGYIDGVEMQSEFIVSETGGINGATGDQTGYEGLIRAYNYNWTRCLRYCGPTRVGSYGWIKSDDRWWYRHSDGSYTTNGWEYIDNEWYYFDQDGWMQTGWILYNGHWYWLYPQYTNGHPEGAMAYSYVFKKGDYFYVLLNDGILLQNNSIELKANNSGELSV